MGGRDEHRQSAISHRFKGPMRRCQTPERHDGCASRTGAGFVFFRSGKWSHTLHGVCRSEEGPCSSLSGC